MAKCVAINIEILKWARESAGFSIEDISKKFSKISDWESGIDAPTYRQLEELASKFKRPIALFFFNKPPIEASIEKSFRSISNENIDSIPPSVNYIIRKAKGFQLNLIELLENESIFYSQKNVINNLSSSLDVKTLIEIARKFLNLNLVEQKAWRSPEKSFENWRRLFANSGIYVFKDAFNCEDFSGFCIYDEKYPVIFINNTTSATRQIFTLFHELGHLLLKFNHIDIDYDDSNLHESNILLDADYKNVEMFCNQFAADFLVPTADLNSEIKNYNSLNETSIDKLSKTYSVSREVVLRKLFRERLIDQHSFFRLLNLFRVQSVSKSNGGMYYNTQASYLGKSYVNLVLNKFYQDKITTFQAADYLNIKPKNFEKFESNFAGIA